MLKLDNVSKNYGKNQVLSDISLDFADENGIYGLLARNGAGKTTLMMMIANQISDYSGNILLNQNKVKENDEALNHILLFGTPIPDDNILFDGKLANTIQLYQEAVETFDGSLMQELMHSFDLDPKTKYGKLSSGNKTLFTNSLALASRTAVTLLDEPTNGLDSINRQLFFRKMMEDYSAHPRMFIVSTHLIAEVENYLTHAIMIGNQNVVLSEPIENIQEKAFRVTNFDIRAKNIVATENIAGITVTDIYDNLSTNERREIEIAGGKVDSLNLQDLFNGLLGGENHE